MKDRLATAAATPVALNRHPITADRTRFLLNFLDKLDRYVSGDVGVHQDRNAGEVLGEEAPESGIELSCSIAAMPRLHKDCTDVAHAVTRAASAFGVSGCFRLECSPGGTCTHWKAPPYHGAHPSRT